MTVAKVSHWDRIILEAEERGRQIGLEQAVKAAGSACFGAPSKWPTAYPRNWLHPPAWKPDRVPTPSEAAMHDNGVFDAMRAIRRLATEPPAAPLNPGDQP